jgi:PAS domain S-box-containing protein
MNYPFSQVVDNIKDSVLVVTDDGNIEYANKAFEITSGWSHKRIVGANIEKFLDQHDTWFKEKLFKKVPHLQVSIQSIDNVDIPLEVNHFMEFTDNNLHKNIFILKDITNEVNLKKELNNKDKNTNQQLHEYANKLKSLHSAVMAKYESDSDAFQKLLEVGCKIMDMDLGIVSQVQDDHYEVIYCFTEKFDIEPGMEFELRNTYCSKVIYNSETVTYNNVGSEPSMRGHPVYEALSLESYIGVPLFVNDKLFGTLNFTSKKIKNPVFNSKDIELIELLASSIERLLERTNRA